MFSVFLRSSHGAAETFPSQRGHGTVAAGVGSVTSARGWGGCFNLSTAGSLPSQFTPAIWSGVSGRESSGSLRSFSDLDTRRAQSRICSTGIAEIDTRRRHGTALRPADRAHRWMAPVRRTLAGPWLRNRTPLGAIATGGGTRGNNRRRQRHPCHGTATGPCRRRSSSVRERNILGRASHLHVSLPARPRRSPDGSGPRHAWTHHPGAVASLRWPGLRVASRARVLLDNGGISRFQARRLRVSRRSVRNACAPVLYPRAASPRGDGGWVAHSVAAGTGGSTRRRACSRRMESRAR